MKIKKLYTLSQFVDLISKQTDGFGMNFSDWDIRAKAYLILKYNSFLKQPLKKEMFINPIKQKWEDGEDGKKIMVHDSHYDKWVEAEKKIIFEGITYIEELNHVELYYNHNFVMQFHLKNIGMNYIYDLAEKINEELELKNVEI